MARKIDGRGETATRDQKVVATIFENLDTSNAVTVNEVMSSTSWSMATRPTPTW